jgi:predicted hotdog family 3-hydroxylacyl-ACP dehydratase
VAAVTDPLIFSAAQIARLIPHADGMCLLAGVRRFDPQSIACSATSHRLLQNPLREQGMLHAVCGVEYAAQAMAVHGALLHGPGDRPPRGGRLAGVRSLELKVSRLDDIDADLDICATLIMGDENSMVYEFAVGDGARNLMTGKATIVLVSCSL